MSVSSLDLIISLSFFSSHQDIPGYADREEHVPFSRQGLPAFSSKFRDGKLNDDVHKSKCNGKSYLNFVTF